MLLGVLGVEGSRVSRAEDALPVHECGVRFVSWDTLTEACEGEASGSSGYMGLGKLMSA